MPRDRSDGKFGPFTTSLPAQAHSLSQTTQLCCPTTDRLNAYVDCYQGTRLPWFVIIFLFLAHLHISLFMAKALRIPHLVIAMIILGGTETITQTVFFLFACHISW
jgi:hypothetical protein